MNKDSSLLELLDNMKHKKKRDTTAKKMGKEASSSMLGYVFARDYKRHEGMKKFVLTNQTKDNILLFEKLKEIIKIVIPL